MFFDRPKTGRIGVKPQAVAPRGSPLALPITGGSLPTSPDQIGGLTFWYSPSGLTGNDGDPVATWTDQSATGDATQSGAPQPNLKKNIVNGFQVVRFDGSSDWMLVGSRTVQTIFCVMAVAPGGNTLVDGAWGQNNVDAFNVRRDNTPNTSSAWRGQSGDGNTDAGDFAFSGSFYVNGVRTATMGEGVWHQWCAIGGSAATHDWSIGGQVNGSRFLACDIAELFGYSTALSTTFRVAMQNYLSAKYAI